MSSNVYGHYANGVLFYIGKGSETRSYDMRPEARNETWAEIAKGNEVEVRILYSFDSEAEALDRECELIRSLTPCANKVLPRVHDGGRDEINRMKRGNTKTVTMTDKEFALIKMAAGMQEKSIASFMRDAAIAAASKEMK